MAIKDKVKTGVKKEKTDTSKTSAMEQKTTLSFRTKELTKKKAEKIFDDLGISMSGALNMFLAQVVRDKGMPFVPTTQKKGSSEHVKADGEMGGYALEELWEEL